MNVMAIDKYTLPHKYRKINNYSRMKDPYTKGYITENEFLKCIQGVHFISPKGRLILYHNEPHKRQVITLTHKRRDWLTACKLMDITP